MEPVIQWPKLRHFCIYLPKILDLFSFPILLSISFPFFAFFFDGDIISCCWLIHGVYLLVSESMIAELERLLPHNEVSCITSFHLGFSHLIFRPWIVFSWDVYLLPGMLFAVVLPDPVTWLLFWDGEFSFNVDSCMERSFYSTYLWTSFEEDES